MSDLEPKRPETQATSPAVGTTPNPPRRMTVWYKKKTDTFGYSSNNGDLEIVRHPNNPAEFAIHFDRGNNEGWKFVNWASSPRNNAPVFTPGGQLVLELDPNIQPATMRLTDRVEYDDSSTYTYKYSLAIKLASGEIKTEDPEIKNRREPTTASPTDH